jgi:hypothetical protein
MNNRHTIAAASTVALLLLAGCSAPAANSSSHTPEAASAAPTSAEPSPSPSPTQESATLESIAAKAGIADFARSKEAAPLAIAWGQGTLNGSVVKLYQFADEAAWQSFLQSVAGFGITEAQMVKVGLIAIAPNDQTQLEAIRASVG